MHRVFLAVDERLDGASSLDPLGNLALPPGPGQARTARLQLFIRTRTNISGAILPPSSGTPDAG